MSSVMRQSRAAHTRSPAGSTRRRDAGGTYRGPRFGPWRRRAIAVVYCLVLLGSPLGHAGLLGLHLITAHGWRPVSAWITERIQHELNVALRDPEAGGRGEHAYVHPANGADFHAPGDHEHSHDHPHESPVTSLAWRGVSEDDSRAAGETGAHSHDSRATSHAHDHRAPTAEPGADGDHGLHEHDGFVHSHEPDLAQRLATLTSKLSEHYLQEQAIEFRFDVSLHMPEWEEPSPYPTVYRRVEIPPPRT